MHRAGIVAVSACLLILCGCQNETSDSRLVEIAVEQNTQKSNIEKMTERVEGFEKRLGAIEESLEKVALAIGTPDQTKTTETTKSEPKVVEFKDAPEYGQIMAHLANIQQQLNSTQSGLTESQQAVANEQEQQRLRDPGGAWQAITNPQEMTKRLDLLTRNFSQKIQDPTRRQQFEADVEQLKRNLSVNPSPQELYQRVSSDLTERLNREQDQRSREFIQRQLQELQSASGEDLQGRLDRYSRFQTFRQLREFQQKYDIPRDAFSNAGLPAVGGGEGGGPRGNRRGGQQGGN